MKDLTPTATPKQIAAQGIIVESINLKSCRFDDHRFDAIFHSSAEYSGEPEGDNGVDLKTEVNVFLRGDEGAMVELSITAEPRHQPSWTANVVVIGHYTVTEAPVIPLRQFAWNNGVAYLIPFARERLASLSGASMYEPYFLPPISVPALLALAGIASAPPVSVDADDTISEKASTKAKKVRRREPES